MNDVTNNSAIRDNRLRGSVGDYLRGKIKPDSKLSFVSAYFTIFAFEKLKDELNSIKSLDFLFGEPSFIKSMDPSKSRAKSFQISNDNLELKNKLEQKQIAKECAEWIKEKVNIKSIINSDLLHGKMYHINNDGIEEAIIGSSNFTVSGLGLSDRSNIELNLEVLDRRDTEELKKWFTEIWNDSSLIEDVKEQVLDYLNQLYTDYSPEFIYYKTLFHIFLKFLTEEIDKPIIDEKIKVFDTEIWKILFDFQKDAARAAINKLKNYNGCILADSVGLGKTFTALAVIKFFELKNERVLVLCPKRLRENWTVYLAENNSELNILLKDRFNYTVLSHTDLSRDEGTVGNIRLQDLNWGNYDLVVIDESHNFRNNTKGKRDEEGIVIRKSRYERLMEDIIQQGIKTKVLLLSATPVNTALKDLRNQINFITADNVYAFNELLNIGNYSETLRVAQLRFHLWAKSPQRILNDLLINLDSEFFKLLDALTIARSRKHIKKYYDLKKIGTFPEREKPISVFPDIDLQKRFMSYDKLNDEISQYSLSLFNPSKYVKDEFTKLYQGKIRQFTQADREYYLIAMMKINFMKRIESSINSFRITMDRTISKIEALEEKINNYKNKVDLGELDPDEFNPDDSDDEELKDALQVGAKIKFNLSHLKLDDWLNDLKKDKDQLFVLASSSKDVTPDRDAKLQQLKNLIKDKVSNPLNTVDGKPIKKILIFTAFADTAYYLYNNLKDWIRSELHIHVALVTGGNSENKTTFGRADYNSILTNFSPISKGRSKMPSFLQDDEIDILIATDCISEGQNLQDCDYLINYDIHWNPVRIIQRFGRIDRIGSKNKKLIMVNFWPTKDLNKYIKLKERVESRMALVDITATAEENLLNDEQFKDVIDIDLKYRDKQLLKLREEILDLEDMDENISLSEFSLDDFRMELLRYIEANREKLENAPTGIYSLTQSIREYQAIKPGVIFCLRQNGDTSGNEKVNPVQPHYLIYVQDDGEIRLTFVHTKQILEIFRLLCSNKTAAIDELVHLFDLETQQGKEMTKYSILLKKSINAITQTFRKRMAVELSKRSGLLIPEDQQPNYENDFELITWLVIKSA